MNQWSAAIWSKRRLQWVLVLFFAAITIPTVILIFQSSKQLKWEAFHQQRLLSEELVKRIDRRYQDLLAKENARPFTDFSFLNIVSGYKKGVLKRSPLAAYPVKSFMPGVLGYFQIDNDGRFTSPILPESRQQAFGDGISSDEFNKRMQLKNIIYQTLSENQLLGKPSIATQEGISTIVENELAASPATSSSKVSESKSSYKQAKKDSQAGFDRLQDQLLSAASGKKVYQADLGRVEDLKLEKEYSLKSSKEKSRKKRSNNDLYKSRPGIRKEQNVLPEPESVVEQIESSGKQAEELRVNIFESEIDAYEFSRLNSGHFVLYRKVWRNGHRFIQGMLIEVKPFINQIIARDFNNTLASDTSHLTVAYDGDVLSVIQARKSQRYLSSVDTLQGTLLLQANLSQSLGKLELIFSVNKLPAGPGGVLLAWLSLIIVLVLCGGFILIYRLGLKQIRLARQQQDFISAVSHELKTPLTSIRMYGEILKEGWADEIKKKNYYQFIYDESERLTRLINNVLQMARLSRNDLNLDLKICQVSELIDVIQSKVSSLLEQNEFTMNILCDSETGASSIKIDMDYFTQVFINLIDNAIKFSSKSNKKQIDVGCYPVSKDQIQLFVRDYGPGIDKDQARSIFKLFYRTECELTRETVGTGIGLALVQQLVQAMNGRVDVVNRNPGAEFSLYFNITE